MARSSAWRTRSVRKRVDTVANRYRHMGRDFRLTDVDGQVVKGILT
jgi:hypothetical protein